MAGRPPARFSHAIDDEWRRRIVARLDDLGWSKAELMRRLAREGVALSHSALSLTLHSGQAGSRYKLDIERVLGIGDSSVVEKNTTSSESATAAQPDAVQRPDRKIAKNFPLLVAEASALTDEQAAAVLAIIRAIRSVR